MAIFEDVNGVAHAVSTQRSMGEVTSEGTSSSRHNRDGSVEVSSHTLTTRPDGKTVTVDTLDTSKEVNGTVYHTTKVLSDDGQGHRSESLSNSFEQNKNGAQVIQKETVTKQLGAHEAPVDLTKALEERGTLGVTHDLTLSRETHGKDGSIHSDTVARHFDTVGNESRTSWGSVSEAQTSHNVQYSASSAERSTEGGVGISSGRSSHSSSESLSSGSGHSVGAQESVGRSASHAPSFATASGISSGWQGASAIGHSESYSHSSGQTNSTASTGLSAHVSQSIENRLVSEGYSVAEARETVKGVSEALGHAVSTHTAGTSNSVEFHKEGPVAVSMTSGDTVSSSKSVAISMDELKAVHESGQVHSLQSGMAMTSSGVNHGASMEMAR